LLLLLLLLQTAVDVVLGDSPVLSRHHARILYNFVAKQWELLVEVSGQGLLLLTVTTAVLAKQWELLVQVSSISLRDCNLTAADAVLKQNNISLDQ
jgi:hypothetical protein